MEHLEFEQIIKYVSANTIDQQTLDFIGQMNIHLSECKECAEKVDAFQLIYDRLEEKTAEKLYKLKEDFETEKEPFVKLKMERW